MKDTAQDQPTKGRNIMAKHQKTKRTQIKDLPIAAKNLTRREASQVRGGLAVSDPGDDRPKNPKNPKGSK
jgi:hypothetical protein